MNLYENSQFTENGCKMYAEDVITKKLQSLDIEK